MDTPSFPLDSDDESTMASNVAEKPGCALIRGLQR